MHNRPAFSGARMKRIPLLLCLLSGTAVGAETLAPLYISPDLVRGATPMPAATPAPPSGAAVAQPVTPSAVTGTPIPAAPAKPPAPPPAATAAPTATPIAAPATSP